ncbi:MAG: hypothetical protein N2746_09600 [Deltaproteobacteria bacterium]|nr:hypothetical protein [Deltaproteobacteria bacterium]
MRRFTFCFVFLTLLFSVSNYSYAQGWCGPSTERFPDEDDCIGVSGTGEEFAGDPIQVNYDGVQYHKFDDVVIRIGDGKEFKVQRVYTSNIVNHVDAPSLYSAGFKETSLKSMRIFGEKVFKAVPDPDNNFLSNEFVYQDKGINWKLNYNIYISSYYPGYYSVVTETGRVIPFDNPGENGCNGICKGLSGIYNGILLEEGYRFLFIDKNGKRYLFRKCAEFGENFHYCADNGKEAFIDRIENIDGSSIKFYYNIPGEDGYKGNYWDDDAFLLKKIEYIKSKIYFDYIYRCEDTECNRKYPLLRSIYVTESGIKKDLIVYNYYDVESLYGSYSVLKRVLKHDGSKEEYEYLEDKNGRILSGYMVSMIADKDGNPVKKLRIDYDVKPDRNSNHFTPQRFRIVGRDFDIHYDGERVGWKWEDGERIVLKNNLNGELTEYETNTIINEEN